MTDALRMTGIGRHFGRAEVLAGIDLAIPPGEHVALRGANGSGKTTLLRIAATVLRPTAGGLKLMGFDGHTDAARRNVTFLSDSAPVYDELTPREHLTWWLSMHRRHHGIEDVRPLLDDAGLAKLAHRPCRQLSRGQRQRLAIQAAFATGSELIVLDEPGSGLDSDGKQWLAAKMHDHPRAWLAAVHDQIPAHRTLHIEGGRLT